MAPKTTKTTTPEVEINDVVIDETIEETTDADEISPEELQSAQSEAKAKIDAKLAEKKAKEKESEKEFYSKDETQRLIQEAIERFAMQNRKDNEEEDVYDPSLPRKHEVVVPRINNKFILGFENLNKDTYRPDLVLTSIELTRVDKTTGKNITEPWVKVILLGQDEKDTVDYPLSYLLKNSSKVACELLERKQVDASYDFGLIQQTEVEEYATKMKDSFIKSKVTMYKESFVVRDPINEEVFEVSPDVINWAQVKVIN